MTKPPIHLLRLEACPIWEQLRIEEALIRADERNWCVVNNGSPKAIVMGISGKANQLLDLSRLRESPIPVIRRFSGGGTVVVDANTLFTTFICNHSALPIQPCYPEPIMRWTEAFYSPLLPPKFRLMENDYVIGAHKFGGNAQYLRKNRWLHHSSMLWDYCPINMQYLLLPEKRPKYREDRTHDVFLSRLSEHFPCRHEFLNAVIQRLTDFFKVDVIELESVQEVLQRSYRMTTREEKPSLGV